MKAVLRIVCSVLVLGLCSTQLAFAAPTTLLMNLITAPTYPFYVKVVYPWAKDVEKVTQGRVVIAFTPTPIVPPAGQWDAVVNDVVDIAFMYHGLNVNRLPLEQLALLPLGTTNAKGTSIAAWRTYQKFFKGSKEFDDVQLLGLLSYGPGEVFGIKKPLADSSDFNGLKMWSIPGASASVVREFKAGVVSTPAVEMTQLIVGGVVDGYAGISANDSQTNGVLNYAKYETIVPGGLTSSSFSLFVNRGKWMSISEKDRTAILAISGEAFARRLAAIDDVEKSVVAEAKKVHLTVQNATPHFMTELKAAAGPLDDAWIKQANALGIDGKAALEYFRQQAQENAR